LVKRLDLFKSTRTNYTNLDFFNEINTEEKAYWLGFIYADGCIHKRSLIISLSRRDEVHLQKLANIFNKHLYFNSIGTFGGVRLEIIDESIVSNLKKCGILNMKTYDPYPTILNHIPENLVRHFIRGYFDGDGCISRGHIEQRRIQFNLLGVEKFLEDIKCIIQKHIPTITNRRITYRDEVLSSLNYSSISDIKEIYKWLYNNVTVWLERKKDKFEEIIKIIEYHDVKFVDREPPYKGVYKNYKHNSWKAQIGVKHIKNCKTEIEAAYYHDLEFVRQRGSEALKYMNFPSQYDDFVELIKLGD
jgi:intein/homing endonuclease